MAECSVYSTSSLQADSKVIIAAWPTSLRPPGADRLNGQTVSPYRIVNKLYYRLDFFRHIKI